MMSPKDTLLEEEEGADVDGVDMDRAEREGRAAKSDCCNRKMVRRGKRNRKMA